MSAANNTRNTPTSGPGETQHNVHNAALKGATLAFSKPPVKPKPLVNTYTGEGNGALRAASKGWTTSTPQGNLSPVQKQWTGGSYRGSHSPRVSLSKRSSTSTLDIPHDEPDRMPSPSNIAAKLAAARHTPIKPKPEARQVYIPYNRDQEEQDIMPPAGSVGNAKALLNVHDRQPLQRSSSAGGSSIQTVTPRTFAKDDKPTDDISIPLTSSLVSMFEQNRPTTPTQSRPKTPAVAHGAPPPIRSPKPQRKFKPPVVESGESRKPDITRHKTEGAPPPDQKPAQLSLSKTHTIPPKPSPKPTVRPKSQASLASVHSLRRPSTAGDRSDSPSSYVSAPETQPPPEAESEKKARPELPPPRRSMKPKSEPTSQPMSTEPPKKHTPSKPLISSRADSKLSLPETFSPSSSTPIPRSNPPDTIYHNPYQRESVRHVTKHLTGESLANAIVGASLASSRNASPAPSTSTPPPPLPSRHQPQKKHHHHNPFHHSRSPSPTKPKYEPGKLRATMRRDPSSSSSEDETERYKRKGTRIMGVRRKHPNKHHEGTRKRWRDTVTERERKRYEGVWAANKGLNIPFSREAQSLPGSRAQSQSQSPSPSRGGAGDPSEDVLNLVARDIWGRSRLPLHELEEVWDLVDSRGIGRLRREEFVVGLWLIDQRLKGRKIPIRVSDSVWGSVRGAGVRVKPVKT